MSATNLYAHTEPSGQLGYPAYVSVNFGDDGKYSIAVRSSGQSDASQIELSSDQLRSFTEQVSAKLPQAGACQVPPPGWSCTRKPGHDKPCAAVPAYQQRVLDERGDLLKRLIRLKSFMASPEATTIEDAEKGRLFRQCMVMGELLNILTERIECFGGL